MHHAGLRNIFRSWWLVVARQSGSAHHLADDRIKALSICCGEQKLRKRMCGSVVRRSKSAAVSRDLPMPASPDSNTTWPSPVFAFDHRRSSSSSSSSRPTSSVRPLVCMASNRLSTEEGRSATDARCGAQACLKIIAPSPVKRWLRATPSRTLRARTSAHLARRAAPAAGYRKDTSLGLVEIPFLLATLLLAEPAIQGMFGHE